MDSNTTMTLFNKDTTFSLALGGGAARGLAHIGVIRELERRGMKPGHIA
jgi:predicted acylesterase/phospholipase RssA